MTNLLHSQRLKTGCPLTMFVDRELAGNSLTGSARMSNLFALRPGLGVAHPDHLCRVIPVFSPQRYSVSAGIPDSISFGFHRVAGSALSPQRQEGSLVCATGLFLSRALTFSS